jgi:glycosyltransferase involved in cell wall biosynthesis
VTIAFVNYRAITSNSGNHILRFARELRRLNHEVIIANFKIANDNAHDAHGIANLSYSEFWEVVERGLVDRAGLILHAWTPRENVRSFVERLALRWNLPYLVHLEDNEISLTAARVGLTANQLLQMSRRRLQKIVPKFFTDPSRMQIFLRNAIGVTVITPSLVELCPRLKKTLVLEPGVDAEVFKPADARTTDGILREFGLSDAEHYVVYPGNTNFSNKRDIEALYEAVSSLRSKGTRVALIRTGRDHTRPDPDLLRRNDGLLELGILDRARLIRVLQIASFFVQPGAPDEFNAYRLPSKIPECLAMARPVVMPKTNIGLRMRDNEDAVLMSQGDSEEIAAKLLFLIDNPSLASRIGANGRRFAIENFSWTRSARDLSDFYAALCTEKRNYGRSPRVTAAWRDWLARTGY